MNFDFNDEQAAIRDAARGLLRKRSPAAAIHRAANHGLGEEEDALWQEMRAMGWAGMGIPEALGGQDLGLVELCLVLEEQGATLSPTPLLPSACAARLLLHGGTGDQREDWLPKLASGAARGAIGLISGELGDAALTAGVSGADIAALAGDGGGVLVDLREAPIEAVETIDPLRSYGLTTAAGAPLAQGAARGLDEAAICVSAELLGVARQCLETTVEYVKQRKQFGVPVGSFQAVSHRCAQMLYDVESARAAVFYAAWAADCEPQRLPEAAAIAKYVASTGAVAVAAAAIQAHGGVGFTWEGDLHWWFKRAQLDAQLLGGPAEHRRRIGDLLAKRAGGAT